MKLLITGFEPFGGSTVNPSAKVITALATNPPEGIVTVTQLLPVDCSLAPSTLINILSVEHPDGVICLGEASGRQAVSVERVAVNLLDFRIPDNAGIQKIDEAVIPGGPAAYFSTLPVRQISQAILDAHIPAELSLSAGSYLCNQVLYHLLHFITVSDWKIPAGFIHLPSLPEQAANKNGGIPSMCLETAYQAVLTAIRVVASRHS